MCMYVCVLTNALYPNFFFNIYGNRKMRPRRVCPEKEALKFIASGTDKDIFQKEFMSQEKGKCSFKILPPAL